MNLIQECKPILLVEDNESILESFKAILEMEGYLVVTAKNGLEALTVLEDIKQPCLILLDLFMPIMDGFQFIDQLKKRNENFLASPPIIICSAAGEKAEEAAKQVHGLISKPVDIEILMSNVRKYCACA